MFRKILVATDLSEASDHVIRGSVACQVLHGLRQSESSLLCPPGSSPSFYRQSRQTFMQTFLYF